MFGHTIKSVELFQLSLWRLAFTAEGLDLDPQSSLQKRVFLLLDRTNSSEPHPSIPPFANDDDRSRNLFTHPPPPNQCLTFLFTGWLSNVHNDFKPHLHVEKPLHANCRNGSLLQKWFSCTRTSLYCRRTVTGRVCKNRPPIFTCGPLREPHVKFDFCKRVS